MNGSEIYSTIKEALGLPVSLFRPTEFRLALYFLAYRQDDVKEFYSSALRETLERVESNLGLLKPAALDQWIGEEGTPFREGLTRAFVVMHALDGEGEVPDEAHMSTLQALRDAAEDASLREWTRIQGLREASAQRLAGLPDRLMKPRTMAEDAIRRSLSEQSMDRVSLLRHAEEQLREVMEQPSGARDPMTCLLFGWLSQRLGTARDDGYSSIVQAAQAASDAQDALTAEAFRQLARLQAVQGMHDSALVSLKRAHAEGASPEDMLDHARTLLGANKLEKAAGMFQSALGGWRLAALFPLVDADVMAAGTNWSRFALEREANDRRELQSLFSATQDWVDDWTTVAREVNPDFELPFLVLERIQRSSESIQEKSLFELVPVREQIERARDDVRHAVLLTLNRNFELRQVDLRNLEGTIEQLKLWKRGSIEQIQWARTQQVQAELQERGIVAPGEEQNSSKLAAMFMAVMFGFAGYFVLSGAIPSIGGAIGPATGLGRIIMVLLSVPLLIGGIAAVSDAARRNMAAAERERLIAAGKKEVERDAKKIQDEYEVRAKDFHEQLEVAREALAIAERQLRDAKAGGAAGADLAA